MFKSNKWRQARRSLLAGAVALLALPLAGVTFAQAATVEEVKAKGKIVVGIQGDNAPWGFIDSSGVQDGFDADMAKLLKNHGGHE